MVLVDAKYAAKSWEEDKNCNFNLSEELREYRMF